MEGLPRTTVISIGQHILIEGEDDDNPFVAKVLKLFGDGESQQWEGKLDMRVGTVCLCPGSILS